MAARTSTTRLLLGWLLLAASIGAGVFGAFSMIGFLLVGGSAPPLGIALLCLCGLAAVGATWCLFPGKRGKAD